MGPHFKKKIKKLKISYSARGNRRARYVVRTHPYLYGLLEGKSKQTEETNVPLLEEVLDTQSTEQIPQGSETYQTKRKKVFEHWEAIRQELLNVHIEEMEPATYECGMCSEITPDVCICHDCGPLSYYCVSCCKRFHTKMPYHIPYVWKSKMFVPLLLEINFTRLDGHDCDSSYTTSMVIIDNKGRQHSGMVKLCKCEPVPATLMRYRLWPSTPVNPRIAFDLGFMELLTVLQLECHLSARKFCDALGHMKLFFASVLKEKQKDIYRSVIGDPLVEYSYHRSCLGTFKSILDQQFGSECPVCQDEPDLVSMDANFGLVHKKSAGEGHGRDCCRHLRSYFANHGDVEEFVNNYTIDKKKKVSDCSDFQAGSLVRSKVKNAKLDVTGVFGSICRHDIPLVFMDMTQGERLAYPVYILQKLLGVTQRNKKLLVMYDIACSLHGHLLKHPSLPEIEERCEFAVPVFHSFAHNMKCQLSYGQKFVVNTTLTDGEGIERLWSTLRRYKHITKEMSINNRHDFLTEALLHISGKMIWNMGYKMQQRHSRALQLLSENETIVDDTLQKLEKSVADIPIWIQKWKLQYEKKSNKTQALSNSELFCETSKKIQKKRNGLAVANQEEQVQLQTDIDRLTVQLEKDKKKIKGTSLSIDVEPGKGVLANAVKKRKFEIISKLKNFAVTRQYLSSVMKKYADGQAISIRITKQFSSTNASIRKHVAAVNEIVDKVEEIRFEQCLIPTSEIFKEVENQALAVEEVKCVEAFILQKKAQLEIENIEAECVVFKTYLLKTYESLVAHLQQHRSKKGMTHYVHFHMFKLEQLWETVKNVSTNNMSFPNTVHDIFNTAFETPMLSNEDEFLEEALREIENLHDEEEEGGDDDDEEEEEDDDDDDDDDDLNC